MTAAKKTPKPEQDEPEAAPPALLELDTLTPRRSTILIDKEPYELRQMGYYGIEGQHGIKADQQEFDRLWESDPALMKPEDKKRMGLLLDRLIRQALDAPSEVIARVNDEDRKTIMQLFISAPQRKLNEALAQVVQQMVKDTARDGSTLES
jgi:tRNA A37 N6-isopentenylltransferase MiaA